VGRRVRDFPARVAFDARLLRGVFFGVLRSPRTVTAGGVLRYSAIL